MKIDWKAKLSSRKFWAAIVGFVTPMLTLMGIGDNVITQVTAIIMSVASLITYVIVEGAVDANRTPTEEGEENE